MAHSSSSSSSSLLDRRVSLGFDADGRQVLMPLFGLGLSHNGGWSDEVVTAAIDSGVRLFDTATRYGNEARLGAILAVSMSGTHPTLCREEVFVTTKFWPGDLGTTGSIATDIETALRRSLAALQVDAVDLYLIHWPGRWSHNVYPHLSPAELRREMWSVMLMLKCKGLARSVGVSNFEVRHLDDIFVLSGEDIVVPDGKIAFSPPAINQVELNPLLPNTEIVNSCKSRGIVVEGYCPFAKGDAFRHRTIQQIAKQARYNSADPAAAAAGVSVAALLIQWSAFHVGAVTIPKTTSLAHLRSNLEEGLMKGEIDTESLELLSSSPGVATGHRSTWDPSGVM